MALQKAHNWKTGAAHTSGAATSTVCQFDLSAASDDNSGRAWDNCVTMVTCEILGYSAAGDVAGETIASLFKRVSGTVTQIGAVQNITALLTNAALAAAAVTLDVSGNVIRARATGVALVEIDWFASMKLTMYRPS